MKSFVLCIWLVLLSICHCNGQQNKRSFRDERKEPRPKTIIISKNDTVRINPNGESKFLLGEPIRSFEIASNSITGKRYGRNGISLSLGLNQGIPNITTMTVLLETGNVYSVVCQLSPDTGLYQHYILKKSQ